MEEEIQLIKDQFQSLAEQKAAIDAELKPLNDENTQIRTQISAFEERDTNARVRLHSDFSRVLADSFFFAVFDVE